MRPRHARRPAMIFGTVRLVPVRHFLATSLVTFSLPHVPTLLWTSSPTLGSSWRFGWGVFVFLPEPHWTNGIHKCFSRIELVPRRNHLKDCVCLFCNPWDQKTNDGFERTMIIFLSARGSVRSQISLPLTPEPATVYIHMFSYVRLYIMYI